MIYFSDINLKISEHFAIQNVGLEVRQGELFALLGPNGMGKSTLIDIITNVIHPNSGMVKICGRDFHEMKKHVGVLYEYTPMFYYSTVKEILAYLCVIYNVRFERLKTYIEKLQMREKIDSLAKVLSKGERRKAGILFALVHDPSILILDEPTAGMDPFMRDVCWTIFKQHDRTIFFTTHYWDEATEHADRIAFISRGKIIGIDTPSSFLSNYLNCQQKISVPLTFDLSTIDHSVLYVLNDDKYLIYTQNEEAISHIQKSTDSYSISSIDLKDVYLYLTKYGGD
ncbi:ABC transporter ATP-binding protein [candidate division KSB1 bacterium]|nr:ABC transporter ATP-binding protein [candidate division KSB1 bacterium]